MTALPQSAQIITGFPEIRRTSASFNGSASGFSRLLSSDFPRRSAPGVGAAWIGMCGRPRNCGPVCLRHQSRQPRGHGNQRRDGRQDCCRGAGVIRAGERRGKGRPGIGLRLRRGHLHGHGAVVRSVPPAAGRQSGVVAGFERGRKRPEPEEQDQEDGKSAPHLQLMLHERSLSSPFAARRRVSS